MNHQHVHKKEAASSVASSAVSIIFSIIAASHHWLHTIILILLGSSTNMMASMSGIIWLRRAMVVATLITISYSLYRLNKHKQMPVWMKTMNAISILASFGIIIYSLINFGW